MKSIATIDLKAQYQRLKPEMDRAIQQQLDAGQFIQGEAVQRFEAELAQRLEVEHAISCGNGTDALVLALMALDLQPGDEVIVPSFTYAATVEAVAHLGLVPVFADVEAEYFALNTNSVRAQITTKTRAIIAVHLYGQGAPMDELLPLAREHNLFLIEDNAQAIDARYTMGEGKRPYLGTIGDIGTTSFFPTKNLGCYGDGGAVFTRNPKLADKLRSLAQHGQSAKYYHQYVGLNSRLDTLQAAILQVKLKHLSGFNAIKQGLAEVYYKELSGIPGVNLPKRCTLSDHVFHQYTIGLDRVKRDALQSFLKAEGIASTVYYPLAAHQQAAYNQYYRGQDLSVSEKLCDTVLSLPIHTEMSTVDAQRVAQSIKNYIHQ